MNFLAHCALAQEASGHWAGDNVLKQGLLAGAILADFSKGRISPELPLELQTGIRLHRRIDAYTNQHESIRAVSAIFPDQLRRFAPIFIDLLGDYYLSQQWLEYYQEPRSMLSKSSYAACAEYSRFLDDANAENLHRFLHYMCKVDLLANYHEWHHVEQGLESVLRRLGQDHLFSEAKSAAYAQRHSGSDAFRIYFADLRQQLPAWASLNAVAQDS